MQARLRGPAGFGVASGPRTRRASRRIISSSSTRWYVVPALSWPSFSRQSQSETLAPRWPRVLRRDWLSRAAESQWAKRVCTGVPVEDGETETEVAAGLGALVEGGWNAAVAGSEGWAVALADEEEGEVVVGNELQSDTVAGALHSSSTASESCRLRGSCGSSPFTNITDSPAAISTGISGVRVHSVDARSGRDEALTAGLFDGSKICRARCGDGDGSRESTCANCCNFKWVAERDDSAREVSAECFGAKWASCFSGQGSSYHRGLGAKAPPPHRFGPPPKHLGN